MGSRKIGYGEDCHIIDGGIEDVVGSGRGGMGGVDGRSVVVVGGSISGRARVSIANELSIFSLVLHSLHFTPHHRRRLHYLFTIPTIYRYATAEMSSIFSPASKFTLWRKLWLALSSSQMELGLSNISASQLHEMASQLHNIDFSKANEYEKKFRHDVMAHVHTFGEVAPSAAPILHLGATSCYVGDNADILQMKLGLQLVKSKLIKVLSVLSTFAEQYKDVPTLGYTHYQPAQLTTVGKRCTLWMHDFLLDYHRVVHELENLPLRGVKGTTGTQASFLELFEGDHAKVRELETLVAKKLGFYDEATGKPRVVAVSGQTYTRKIDYHILSLLSAISQSAYKMCGDLRLLSNLKEIEEPFDDKGGQVGSSAMPYKRNPMRSERACSLARYVMSLPINGAHTTATQWLERTLDDSAVRRIVLPEAFLGVDVILNLVINIGSGLVVWPNVIHKHVMEELPFMATEVILMECVKAGGDRQELHEAMRVHSFEAGRVVKGQGLANDLLVRIGNDPLFAAVHGEKLMNLVNPTLFVGRAVEQTSEFLKEEIMPVLEEEKELLEKEIVDGVNV
jgi:adenylosuccinate lyase